MKSGLRSFPRHKRAPSCDGRARRVFRFLPGLYGEDVAVSVPVVASAAWLMSSREAPCIATGENTMTLQLSAHARFLTPVVTFCMLAACGTSVPPAEQQVARSSSQAEGAASWVDGRLEVSVPTPVVLLGFPAADALKLGAALTPHVVDHSSMDLAQLLMPDLEEVQEDGPVNSAPIVGGDQVVLPILPQAVYAVQAAPSAMEAEFGQALESARLDGEGYDANTIEDWLAAALPRFGFPLNPNAPSIVVVHLGRWGATGNHWWRIQGVTGLLDQVRVFGERHPLLVLDASAQADPWNATDEDFASPVETSATETIAGFVREATEYRLLQGSIYPVAQAPCHAVTGIVGIRPTSLSESGLFMRPVEQALVQERVKQAFDHLTGTDVFFDLKVLELPLDDPQLDAITRGEFPLMEVLRGYLTVMWEQYHVDHPGCEEYLSVVVQNDAASVPGGGILGIGTYDDSPGKRISMSWVHEAFRLLWDPESPIADAPLGCQACDGKEYLNWWEYLLSHETGHLFGQRHPHDITSSSSDSGSSDAFSSIWSSMSYQQDGRMIDFGAVDHNNWMRNRAAFALGAAADAGRVGTPEWERAMAAAGSLDWHGTWLALQTR